VRIHSRVVALRVQRDSRNFADGYPREERNAPQNVRKIRGALIA
jgi:hypothetical protein